MPSSIFLCTAIFAVGNPKSFPLCAPFCTFPRSCIMLALYQTLATLHKWKRILSRKDNYPCFFSHSLVLLDLFTYFLICHHHFLLLYSRCISQFSFYFSH